MDPLPLREDDRDADSRAVRDLLVAIGCRTNQAADIESVIDSDHAALEFDSGFQD